jgi:nicotinamide riboside transporter PnuC
MNQSIKILGKEPALWMALFSSIVMVVSAFVFPLTPDQQGVLNAVCTAGFGLATAYFIDKGALSAAILGFVKATFALAIAFGWHQSAENQAILMTAVTSIVAMFVRTQTTPINPPQATAATRNFAAARPRH